jgi:hypothetical protein
MALNEKSVKGILHSIGDKLPFQTEQDQKDFHDAVDNSHKAPQEDNGDDENGEDKE